MEVKATAKYVKVQPRKVRIVADEVRGKSANYTAALLKYHPSKGARLLRKVLVSAMANAQENHNIPAENLRIATIWVNEGPVLKRMRARAMGRGFRIEKKTSHITVVVEEYEGEVKVKQKSKAKPRPTFAAPTRRGGKKKGAESRIEETLEPTLDAAEVAAEIAPAREEIVAVEAEPETASVETAGTEAAVEPATAVAEPESVGGASPESESAAPEGDSDESKQIEDDTAAETKGADSEKGAE